MNSIIISALQYGLDAVQLKKCDSYSQGSMSDFEMYQNQEELIKETIITLTRNPNFLDKVR